MCARRGRVPACPLVLVLTDVRPPATPRLFSPPFLSLLCGSSRDNIPPTATLEVELHRRRTTWTERAKAHLTKVRACNHPRLAVRTREPHHGASDGSFLPSSCPPDRAGAPRGSAGASVPRAAVGAGGELDGQGPPSRLCAHVDDGAHCPWPYHVRVLRPRQPCGASRSRSIAGRGRPIAPSDWPPRVQASCSGERVAGDVFAHVHG